MDAFGNEEVEPSRHAAEEMLVTVSSLKVCYPEHTSKSNAPKRSIEGQRLLRVPMCWPCEAS